MTLSDPPSFARLCRAESFAYVKYRQSGGKS